MKKENKETVIIVLFLFFALWLASTSFIQRMKCPKMTETELFLNIPNSFILDFTDC